MKNKRKAAQFDTHAVVLFAGQVQICVVFLGPQEATGSRVWDFLDSGVARRLSDRLHFNAHLLEVG